MKKLMKPYFGFSKICAITQVVIWFTAHLIRCHINNFILVFYTFLQDVGVILRFFRTFSSLAGMGRFLYEGCASDQCGKECGYSIPYQAVYGHHPGCGRAGISFTSVNLHSDLH
jgi:hypothetical protein